MTPSHQLLQALEQELRGVFYHRNHRTAPHGTGPGKSWHFPDLDYVTCRIELIPAGGSPWLEVRYYWTKTWISDGDSPTMSSHTVYQINRDAQFHVRSVKSWLSVDLNDPRINLLRLVLRTVLFECRRVQATIDRLYAVPA